MINKNQAKKIVYEYLARMELEAGEQFEIIDSETIEKKFGWVFFYNSKKYIETGDFRYMLAGNVPFIIDKVDGSLHETGTAESIDYYISEYVKNKED